MKFIHKEPGQIIDKGWLQKNWFWAFIFLFGLWVWLPFLAPIFMHWGWLTPANLIYRIYAFACHQLPDRSYFLFGPQASYPLSTIQAAWMNTSNLSLLRKFIGNDALGWKIAWSDRMISLYNGIWIFSVFWYPLRKKVKSLPVWGLILFLIPMVLDGGTHFISDLAGHGQGFRHSNQWLVVLTNEAFLASFYRGDMLGSFNSMLRIITGLLAAFGVVWFAFPAIYRSFVE